MTTNPAPMNATAAQFEKVVLRMMPTIFSSMPEGRLIAGILRQAWDDGDKYSSRKFFLNDESPLGAYCVAVGLDTSQIRAMFTKHCAAHKRAVA